jgi:hypothetical protein
MSKNANPQFIPFDKKALNPKGIYKPVGLDVYIQACTLYPYIIIIYLSSANGK